MKLFERSLRAWERIGRELSRARRNGRAEARIERKLAAMERHIVSHLYKETFGHKLHRPKVARSYVRRKGL